MTVRVSFLSVLSSKRRKVAHRLPKGGRNRVISAVDRRVQVRNRNAPCQ